MKLGFSPEALINKSVLHETIIALILFTYVLSVVYCTRFFYIFLRNRGLSHNVVVYYNRKLIHILTGGVVALLVPSLFSGAAIPLIMALILALITYLPHRRSKLMYWFQVEENMYEVNFCIMWGVVITLSWLIFKDPIYGVIPLSFMSFGDAVTGIVRNVLFGKRTKHWIGNVAMLAVSLPIGAYFAGTAGLTAGLVASIIERFEWKPIDDNVLISSVSFIILFIFGLMGYL